MANFTNINSNTMKRRLTDAIDDGNIDAVYGFLERGIDVNYALWRPDYDPAPLTPLMSAAMSDDPTILILLLAYGVDINYSNDMGSVLYYAVFNENLNILRLLLLEGADPFIKDADGETPYDMAVSFNLVHHAEILKHFMDIRRVQRISRRKQIRNRIKTKRNSRRLALMRSMESREGPMSTVRYDPSLMEHVSRYL